MSALKLSFHGTFALKKQDVLKLLEVAETEQALHGSLMELVERTGLGNEKVLQIKSWAVRSGLVSQNHLSPEGAIVRACDPYLDKQYEVIYESRQSYYTLLAEADISWKQA